MKSLTPMAAVSLVLAIASSAALAQDRVTYRDRAAKGPQVASGRIESESLAGIKIGAKLVNAADVLDVQYDLPGAIKLDYPRAVAAEGRSPTEAIPLYEALLRTPSVQNHKTLKRQIEFKIAMLAAARAEESPEQLQKAITAVAKCKKDHPDSWQLVPLTRMLARLNLDKEPPNTEAARVAFEELAATQGAPQELKNECAFQVIDLLLADGKIDDARQKLSSLPANEPRTRVYQIGCQASVDKIADAAKQLEELIDKSADRPLKAAAYNMLGDIYRRDAKTKKDALYAYLWVDVVYNDDPTELAKAYSRLAELFNELKDEERAKKYRDKLRGR